MSDELASGGLVRGNPLIVGDTGPEPFVIARIGERIVRYQRVIPADDNPMPRFHLFRKHQ